MIAYELRLTTDPGNDTDAVVVGLFATPEAAAAHYRGREDLRGYFWRIQETVEVRDGTELPRIEWTPERVAAGLAANGDR